MNGNAELLNYIYKNSQMGQDTINRLLGIVEDENFKRLLESQFREYKQIFDLAEKKLETSGSEVKEISPLSKLQAYMMIDMKTLMDRTPNHISEMLIQGSSKGIIEITRNLKKYSDADQDILDLGNKLLEFEQRNIEELKKFLS
jgi:hypothetical protein